MRTAITVGITKDGKAEIISHPKVAYDKQRIAFRQLTRGKNEKYVEVQFFPSKGRMQRRRFNQDTGKTGVNYNAAHRVDAQQDKRRKLTDLTPKPGSKGGVNMDASIPVEKQGKKKSARPRKTAAKKSTKKPAAHTAGAKHVSAPHTGDNKPAADKGGESESGPTL